MYLEFLINESSVKEEIENNEKSVLELFKTTFSIDSIYNTVFENLNDFISKDNILETFNNIKTFGRDYTLNYLVSTSKQLSNPGVE